ncbi:hypothetical protein BGZ72_001070, partial [Mortierella alpina]
KESSIKASTDFPVMIFITVDVETASDIATQAGVKAMPTSQLYSGGIMQGQVIGPRPEELQKSAMKEL